MTDEELYEAIIKFTKRSFDDLSDERIEGIQFREKNPKYEQDIIDVDVGEVFPITGEPIEAILYDESRELYLICTPTRGVAEGKPILVGDGKAQDVRYFD